jgi:hypothetical protein
MTPYEYFLYSRGFALREEISQVPFRRLYQLIHNCHAKNAIFGAAIISHWPLPLIDGEITGMNDIESRNEEMAVHRAANAERKQRQKELKQRQENANGRA